MITSLKDPFYADASGRVIHCTVEIAGHDGWHSYMAVDGDVACQPVFDALKNGKFGDIAPFDPEYEKRSTLRTLKAE